MLPALHGNTWVRHRSTGMLPQGLPINFWAMPLLGRKTSHLFRRRCFLLLQTTTQRLLARRVQERVVTIRGLTTFTQQRQRLNMKLPRPTTFPQMHFQSRSRFPELSSRRTLLPKLLKLPKLDCRQGYWILHINYVLNDYRHGVWGP